MTKLIEDSRDPTNVSLATFKPTKLLGFEHEEDDREWKQEWKEQLNQLQLFVTNGNNSEPRKLIPKLPYKFFYKFADCNNKPSRLMIEDWEIGQLYFNCLKALEMKMQHWQRSKKSIGIFFQAEIYTFFRNNKRVAYTSPEKPFRYYRSFLSTGNRA